MIVSIYIASNRADNIYRFIENLSETAEDKNSFEILVAVDAGDIIVLESIDKAREAFSVSVKVAEFENPAGYFSLNVGYNRLIPLADKNSYFDWLLNDEIVMETLGWDQILKQYQGFYPDDIFRLRLSNFKLKNYYDIYECMPSPDNYSIQTRQWMKIIDNWGECWAPDPWIECIDYFLRKDDGFIDNTGVWRSIPVFGITLSGQEANQNQTEEVSQAKIDGIAVGWKKYTSHAYQEKYKRYAGLIKAEILRRQHPGSIIDECKQQKKIVLKASSIEVKVLASWSYVIPKNSIIFCHGYRKDKSIDIRSPRLYRWAIKFLKIMARVDRRLCVSHDR